MSIESIDYDEVELSEPVAGNHDGDGHTHTVCCNPDRALCGADVTGDEWTDPDVVTPDDCVVCEDLQAVLTTCGAFACRLRSRIRRWRSR